MAPGRRGRGRSCGRRPSERARNGRSDDAVGATRLGADGRDPPTSRRGKGERCNGGRPPPAIPTDATASQHQSTCGFLGLFFMRGEIDDKWCGTTCGPRVEQRVETRRDTFGIYECGALWTFSLKHSPWSLSCARDDRFLCTSRCPCVLVGVAKGVSKPSKVEVVNKRLNNRLAGARDTKLNSLQIFFCELTRYLAGPCTPRA